MMNIDKMQGFYITIVFIIAYVIIVLVGTCNANPVMDNVINTFSGIIGTIAAFWFATRGQTGNS